MVMKTLGLIGGMSWESTLEYYRILNQATQQTLGGLHSCPVILYSVDFAEIEALQHQGDWAQLSERMVQAAQSL
jgi:aspartate racemase